LGVVELERAEDEEVHEDSDDHDEEEDDELAADARAFLAAGVVDLFDLFVDVPSAYCFLVFELDGAGLVLGAAGAGDRAVVPAAVGLGQDVEDATLSVLDRAACVLVADLHLLAIVWTAYDDSHNHSLSQRSAVGKRKFVPALIAPPLAPLRA